jgi:hypothetical protein
MYAFLKAGFSGVFFFQLLKKLGRSMTLTFVVVAICWWSLAAVVEGNFIEGCYWTFDTCSNSQIHADGKTWIRTCTDR